MPQPGLHIGNVRLILEGVGCRCCPQGMKAQPIQRDSDLASVIFHHGINAVSGDGLIQLSRHVVAGRAAGWTGTYRVLEPFPMTVR